MSTNQLAENQPSRAAIIGVVKAMKIRTVLTALLACFTVLGMAQAQFISAGELVEIETALSVDHVHPGSSFQVAVIAILQEDWHVNAHQPTLEYLIPTRLALESVDGLTFGEILYPESHRVKFEFAKEELDVYQGRVIMRFPVIVSNDASGEPMIRASFRYQACNNEICLAPARKDVTISVPIAPLEQPSRPINSELFDSVALSLPGDQGSGGILSLAQGDLGHLIEEQGLAVAFLAIFVLGLALNLTPCVYPMIPVTLGYFGRQSEGKTSRLFGLALMYLVGIAITYSTMGVVAALTGQLFGALLQNPWVLVGIALVMVALALSLFGVYEIQAPNFIRQKVAGGSGSGVLGALSMGLVVGIVAAPCVGPVTIGLLTYVGSTGNPWLGFGMFFTLSLGLGAPYVVLGTFSGGLKRLPKSGVWMLWVEKLFGCALIGVALYFVAPLIPDGIVPWIVLVLALGSGVWLGWLVETSGSGKTFYALKKATGIGILLVGVFAVVPLGSGTTVTWESYHPDVFDAAQQEGRPVILDFYADWCIPCRELDRFTFADEEVIAAVGPFTRLKVDLTQYESPEAELLRKKFDVDGVPTIIFLNPRGDEVQASRVVGYLGASAFLERVKQALSTS